MDSMEIDDDVYINRNLTMEGLITQVDFQRRKQPSRCVTVCLGLLCAVLLAGNIGQLIYYEIISRPASADPTQASYNIQGHKGSYDALTAERNQLEARLTNLTTEKDQWQQSYNTLKQQSDQLQTNYNDMQRNLEGLQTNYNNVTASKDQLQTNYSNLQREKDQWQQSFNTIKQQSDQLQTSYNDMQRNLEGLKTIHTSLAAGKDQLQTKYSNLQREKVKLQTLFTSLRENRDQLQSNYSSLKRNKDQLQRSYNTLSISKNHLQISYNSLWSDKEQLQTSYNTLQREKQQLQTNYSSLATLRDQLEKKIDKVRGTPCQTGWRKFEVSCYFVSSLKQNWTLSRDACIAEGADLVVIDSRDEQEFVNGLLTSDQNAWIGLTDSLEEGTWMWVDGTPVTTTYWQPGQPNSFNGNQDCGETVQKSTGVGEWNDDGCFSKQMWICEK